MYFIYYLIRVASPSPFIPFVAEHIVTRAFIKDFRIVIAVAVIIAVILRLLPLLCPWPRLWGMDMFRELSLLESALFTLLPLLSLALLRKHDQHTGDALPGRRFGTHIALIFLAVCTLLFPLSTFLYGDGGLLIPQIHRYSLDAEYDAGLLLNAKSSPLAGLLLLAFMKVVPAISALFGLNYPVTALYPFTFISLFSLLGVLLYAIIALPRRERYLATYLILGASGVLLFFGYVEYYAPVYAALLVFLLSSDRALRGEGPITPVLLSFAIALASHFFTLALLPVLLYVLGKRYPGNTIFSAAARRPYIVMAFIIIIGIIVYATGGFAISDNRIVMPLTHIETEAGTLQYTLLSSQHLSDLANLLVLLAPAAVLTLPLMLMPPFRGNRQPDSSITFGVLAMTYLFLFVFFANTSLGLARDWDIAAPLGPAMLFTALVWFRERSRRAMHALGIASICFVLPYLLVQIRSDSATERFERVLRLDDEHMYGDYAISGYEALRKYHTSEGDIDKEIKLTKRMIEILDYPMHYRELIALSWKIEETRREEFTDIQRWMLERLRVRAEHLAARAISRDYSGSIETIDSLAQAIAVQSLSADITGEIDQEIASVASVTRGGRTFPAVEAMRLYSNGRYVEALPRFEQAFAENFESPGVVLLYGNTLALTGSHARALDVLEAGVQRFPENGMLRFTLGTYYYRAGIRRERAMELLVWCLDHGLPPGRLEEAALMLEQLRYDSTGR